ncbi:MAG: glucokinase [Woeseiaceae bacterium]
MNENSLLVGDIGGTNARFALAQRDVPGFSAAMTVPCSDFDSAHEAIEYFLNAKNASAPGVISIAAAGPLVANAIRFTNNHWRLATDDLIENFAGARVRLLNDFEALAFSIPHLDQAEYMQIGLPDKGSLPADNFMVGVVGPGTGLGAVGLKMINGVSVPIASEAGHVGFAPESGVQLELLRALREHFDRVSAERLVSGSGLENIHWALGRVHGQDWPQRTAEEIFSAAQENADGRAAEAVQLFFEVLGQVAGDLALAIGAEDGIYIAGGIVQRYPELFANSRFRAGFENKGRHRTAVEAIPTRLILHKNPGLLGAAVVAADLAKD